MAQALAERFKVIDADTHISEPPDLWTSRVSTERWGDLVPHVVWSKTHKKEVWVLGGAPAMAAGASAQAGWREFPFAHPPTLEEADHASWDPNVRLQRMDEYGIHAQVLYPNVGGFGSGRFARLTEPELKLACVRAYNDFLNDFTSVAPERFIKIMALPFWDVELSVQEIQRCAKNGHRGILFSSDPDWWGEPMLADPHWNPIWATAQDLGLPINFHIGSAESSFDKQARAYPGNGSQANFAKSTAVMFLDNAKVVSEIIVAGICHRYPRLNFVSVESGIGWVPFIVEALDWQWLNTGVHVEHPEYDLLPSEYFKRQVYACFWFEQGAAKAAIDVVGPDNFLYETDFPHPTSMSPGPASSAVVPREFIDQTMGDLPEEVARKLLHDNAARVYRLDE